MDVAIYNMNRKDFDSILEKSELQAIGDSSGPLMKCSGTKDAAWVGRWKAESSHKFRVTYFGPMTNPANIM